MKEIEKILRILGELIDKGVISVEALGDNIKIPRSKLSEVLRELEFLNIVNSRKGKVYLSSQAYSLLFDAIFASRGLSEYLERRFSNGAIKEAGKIPGILVPILLLRAASPHFGVILDDLTRQQKIHIDSKKMQFLLEYFSSRSVDYSPLNAWRDIYFDFDEFYDLWIALNKELLKKIGAEKESFELEAEKPYVTTAPALSRDAAKPTKTSIPSTELKHNLGADDRYFGIPESSLKELFGVTGKGDFGARMHKARTKLPSNLQRITKVKISLPKMLRFIRERKMRTEGLVITKYNKAIKWQFKGKRILVPPMYLQEDGIYIDAKTEQQFSDREKLGQVEYLKNCVATSNELYKTRKNGGN